MESRSLFAGVTIITHGWTSSDLEPPWTGAMQEAIKVRLNAAGQDATLVDWTIQEVVGGQLQISTATPVGPSLSQSNSGELIVDVDWASVNDLSGLGLYHQTQEVASTIASAVLSPGFLSAFAGEIVLATLPVHLIGHSRGGSLVASLARQLGEAGVWVEQLTMVDPVPMYSDEVPNVTRNVEYAESIWQDYVPLASGSPVSGAFNRQFTTPDGGYGGIQGPHGDTHLWYHATINLGDTSDGSASVTFTERSTWFTANEQFGANAGFAFSGIGGLDRARNLNGVSWDRQGYATRSEATRFGAQWPNVGSIEPRNGWTVRAGDVVPVDFLHEDFDSAAESRFFIDRDRNPFNGVTGGIGSFVPPGASDRAFEEAFDWRVAAYAPGNYWIGAIINDGVHQRVEYTDRVVHVEAGAVQGSHQLFAGLDQEVSVGTGAGDLSLSFTTTAGNSAALRHGADGLWHAALPVQSDGGAGPSVTWINPNTARQFVAKIQSSGLYVSERTASGTWSTINLTGSVLGAQSITSQLQVMISPEGAVHLTGLTAANELVRYIQTPSQGGVSGAWFFENITRDKLVEYGQTMPAFDLDTPLISYSTSWGGLNIAGLDAAGNIWSIWWAPGIDHWNSSNLTAAYNAKPLSGALAVYLTSWNGINLAGLDEAGRVQVTWWVPAFGGEWRQSDLTQIAGGALFEDGTLSAYVSSWGGLNLAGRNRMTGAVEVYWWSPQRQGLAQEWSTAPLSQLVVGTPALDRLRGLAGSDQSLSVFGTTVDGQVGRLFWLPGAAWKYENVTLGATWL